MSTLVSVVVPTFNGRSFVRETVESVLGQRGAGTTFDVELIVVDDGSTDGTPELLRPWARHMQLLRQANSGVSVARNAGAARGRGRLIAFLDQDDAWEPDLLATLVPRLLAAPRLGALYADSWVVDAAGEVRGRRSRFLRYREGEVFRDLLHGNFVPLETLLLRRELFDELGGFDPRLRYLEDYDLLLRASRRTRLGLHPGALARYRIHDRNLSHDRVALLLEWVSVLAELPRRLPDLSAEEQRTVDRELARRAADLAWRAMKELRLDEADRWLARAGGHSGAGWLRLLRGALAAIPRDLARPLLARLPRRRLYGV